MPSILREIQPEGRGFGLWVLTQARHASLPSAFWGLGLEISRIQQDVFFSVGVRL